MAQKCPDYYQYDGNNFDTRIWRRIWRRIIDQSITQYLLFASNSMKHTYIAGN